VYVVVLLLLPGWHSDQERDGCEKFADRVCDPCKEGRKQWGGPPTQAKFNSQEAARKASAAAVKARLEVGLSPTVSDAQLVQTQK
jgi:hypothetical protein